MSSAPNAQPVVLLAEDDPDVRATTSDLVGLGGAVVHAFPSGREASRFLASNQVDLILTDMIMPDGDGPWLVNFVRSSPRLSHLPIIVVSARADDEHVADGLKSGADAYLTKPYDPERLLEAVAYWLKHPRAMPQTSSQLPASSQPASAG